MEKKYVELATEEMKKEVTKRIKELPSEIHKMITGALASILGLEWTYGDKFEIDHCNQRNSILIDVIRDIAKKEAGELVKKTDFKPKDISLFQVAFKKEFENQLTYELRKLAENLARTEAQKIMEQLSKEIIGEIKSNA